MRPFYIACISGASVLAVVVIIVCIVMFGSEPKRERDRLQARQMLLEEEEAAREIIAAAVQTAGAQPAQVQPAGMQPAGVQPAQVQPTGMQPAGVQPTSQTPASVTPTALSQTTPQAPPVVSTAKARPKRKFNLKKSKGVKLSSTQKKKTHESIPMPKHIRHTASPVLMQQKQSRRRRGPRGKVVLNRQPRQPDPMTNMEFKSRPAPTARQDQTQAINNGMQRRMFGTTSGRPMQRVSMHKSDARMFRPRMPAEMMM